MKRYWIWVLVVVVIASFLLTFRGVLKARRKRRLATETQAALMRYTRNLRPGLTRREVEAYLRGHNTEFGERGGSVGRHTYATIVKVGEDDVPWYCSEWPVYVLFEFKAADSTQSAGYDPKPDDVLDEVHLGSNGEGCL